MNEESNNKQRNMFLIGLVALLLLVVGATYAYFAVTTVNNFGTSTINATAGGIGTVTLNGNNANLTMDLTALDMVRGNTNIVYYAGESGKTTNVTTVTLGTAEVTPSTDTNYYHCTYTLSVTHSGTNDMYNLFNHQTNSTYDYTNRSTGQIILTINDTDYDFYNAWPTNNQVSGEFYISYGSPQDITASLIIINRSDIDQSYLAGSDIQISISLVNGSLSCTAEEEPVPASETLIALTEDANNASKITKYTGPVTDECGTTSCTTVNSAQNVYVFKSNDLNNVLFEDFCWKIIRTTETGGVKLLYNGLPTTVSNKQQCKNQTGANTMLTATQMNTARNTISYSQGGAINQPADVGYMYNPDTLSGTYLQQLRGDSTYDVNTTDSLLKEKTEYWFNHSSIDESKLEDAVYCNDRSLETNSTVPEANLASATIGDLEFINYSTKTTLECSLVTDSFNTTNTKAQTNYKVGFMTVPEARLITSTVYGNGNHYWLGSPYRFWSSGEANVYSVYNSSLLGENSWVYYDFGVRPVISASSSVQITDGAGSRTNPFIFE